MDWRIISRPNKGGFAMIRHMTGVGAMGLLLVAVLSHPGIAAAHGGAEMEEDPCMRLAGESMVHFSAYQPQYGLKDQYCTEIPQEGETFLVVDLERLTDRKSTRLNS